MAIFICDYCFKKFKRKHSKIHHKYKYCSRKCSFKAMNGKPKLKLRVKRNTYRCAYCNKKIKRLQSNLSNPNRVFCNQKCMGKYRRGKSPANAGQQRAKRAIYNCGFCNKELILIINKVKNQKAVYCNKECYIKSQKGKPNGRRIKREIYICDYCHKEFERLKCQTKNNKKHYCNNICRAKDLEGCIPWNKGLTKDTTPQLKGNTNPRTESEILRLRQANIGKKYPDEVNYKKGAFRRGRTYKEAFGEKRAKEIHIKQSKTRTKVNKKLLADPTYVAKMMKTLAHHPNPEELYLDAILQLSFPHEWKFVGDGEFLIERKNPDFININGVKAIIEYNGFTSKNKDGSVWGHTPQRDAAKARFYAKYGFKTLNLYPKDLKNEIKLINKINKFIHMI